MSKKELVYRSSDLATSEEKTLESTFSVYNDTIEIFDGFYERILPGAFEYRNGEVKALINHDTSPSNVIGSLSAKTLELEDTENSLDGVVHLPNTTNGKDLYESVKRGDVNKCSIGFEILDSDIEEYEDGYLETIKRATLWEVSVVTFPAYDNTSVSARSIERIEDLKDNKKREVLIKKLKERGVVSDVKKH